MRRRRAAFGPALGGRCAEARAERSGREAVPAVTAPGRPLALALVAATLALAPSTARPADPVIDAATDPVTDATTDPTTDAATDPPLSFDFLENPPGELVPIGAQRLHLHCRGGADGDGAPTVLFEAGLGGSALEWTPVAERLAAGTRVCTYDRAGYGWSDPSAQPRHALRLAWELDRLVDAAAVPPPFVLVAHSFGGFVARLFAERRSEDVAALVLIDTSHEDQFARLETPGGKPMGPRNRQFVISQNPPPPSLPARVRRQVAAFGRMRKTYSATHGEMATFRESASQVLDARGARAAPHPFEVVVIRRGRDLYAGREGGARKTAAWTELQEDLAALGRDGRVVVATGSGHHVHADDPELVAREIDALVAAWNEARGGSGTGTDGERDAR